jgi:ABC-type antimicrobial peptide transport system permease subunit
MAYAVGDRRREIGIRGALGASPGDIMRLVMGQSARLTALGAGVGLVFSLPIGWLLGSFLFRVGPADPVALSVAPLLLASTALVAAYVPAARATRIQPVEALRRER